MSGTVDIGIDLGTTNSAIAVMENGRAEVLQGIDENQDVLPSCVSFFAGGSFVGLPAKNALLSDPENSFEGFKRDLGTSTLRFVPALGRAVGPEELSAEVLKELRSRAAVHLNNMPLETVITVPAAFGEIEKHAVLSSARLAGFDSATLVQEPVAAGLAYGWDQSGGTKPFLVYDFGGGTFDASVLRAVAGQLLVLKHDGIKVEGGRDMDDAILEKLVMPAMSKPIKHSPLNLRKARLACEAAKTRLSNPLIESTAVNLESIQSLGGDALLETIHISRADVERVVTPQIERTIQLVRELLEQLNLRDSELGAVILVGGPTRMPIVRRLLQENLKTEIYTRINPMTVVAQGAALFAASVPKTQSSRRVVQGIRTLDIEYDHVANQPQVPVGIGSRLTPLEDGTVIRIRRDDGLWDSGLLQVQAGMVLTNVPLSDMPISRYLIEIFDKGGSGLEIEPKDFSITRGLAAAPPPLSRSIGVAIEDTFSREVVIEVLIKHGAPTPTVARRKFLTTRQLIPGSLDAILTVGFFEVPPAVTWKVSPERCHSIGQVPVTGQDIDRPLPLGTEVEVSIRIDATREPVGQIYFPILNKTFQTKLHFINPTLPSEEDLHERLEALEVRAGAFTTMTDTGHLFGQRMSTARNALSEAKGKGTDALVRAHSRLEEAELAADEIDAKDAPLQARQELLELIEWSSELVENYGTQAQIAELQRLRYEAENASTIRDLDEIQAMRNRIMNLCATIWWSQPGAWIARFQELASSPDLLMRDEARYLIQRGKQSLELGDQDLLRRTVLDLIALMPEDHRKGKWAIYSGLVRGA